MASAVTNFFKKDETKSVLSDYFEILIYFHNQLDQKTPICEGRYLIKMS